MYRIFDEHVSWTTAKQNCEGLGGKLAEIETHEENEFIKNEVKTRDTGVFGYWLGGYNFNQDSEMEWISNPSQVMPFDDMYPGEPNNPSASLCMGTWKVYDYKWGDYGCGTTISYICEF
ncbi:perlucin-like protein [Mytilus edulis]|uniref:perlucin-like protein n=1 Tax=Mytilus edulis TaxID=6550 RepID=UPI0039EE4F6F